MLPTQQAFASLSTAAQSGWRQLRSFRTLLRGKLVGASMDPDPLHLDAGPTFGQDDFSFHPTLNVARPREQPRETRQESDQESAKVCEEGSRSRLVRED